MCKSRTPQYSKLWNEAQGFVTGRLFVLVHVLLTTPHHCATAINVSC